MSAWLFSGWNPVGMRPVPRSDFWGGWDLVHLDGMLSTCLGPDPLSFMGWLARLAFRAGQASCRAWGPSSKIQTFFLRFSFWSLTFFLRFTRNHENVFFTFQDPPQNVFFTFQVTFFLRFRTLRAKMHKIPWNSNKNSYEFPKTTKYIYIYIFWFNY